jgi:hypothetical protein
MATAGWVEEVGPKSFVSARDPELHALPVGHEPQVGTAWMLIDAFVLAEEAAAEPGDRSLFRSRADFLVRAAGGPERGGALANPWFQLFFDRHPPGQ